jgi:glycyl-tRNA synthetase beta chain
MNSLLLELFVEELPPKALKKLGEAFASLVTDQLKAQGLAAADAVVTSFASPRRLALHIGAVAHKAADKATQTKLMPVAVALDAAGAPTPALLKKLGALGLDASVVNQLKRLPDGPAGKAEALFVDSVTAGATLAEGLQKALTEALAKLPIPKVMQYQLADGWTTVNFVRPAHGLVALHGDAVVPVSALGLQSGRSTQGHRFEAKLPVITLRNADSYAAQLQEEGAVIASFAQRRAELVRQLYAAAAKEGLKPIEDEALLDEVTALVERPNVLLCRFEPEFLAVPQECLILTMKANQKYFPLLDAAHKLTEKFLIVSNISPTDPSRVIEGNERVVRPRLADAKFFFDQDRKKTLASRVPQLDRVVYHGKLGSQGQRMQRVQNIAVSIASTLANAIGNTSSGSALTAQAERAALLAKTDLLTDMVGEFPELQGTMGGYYARHDGETEAVALAIEDHYKPRFAGDALPREQVGVVLALADKLETLAGLFGIGQVPTGDKDPFALRRHALGVIRLLIEKKLALDVPALLTNAFAAFAVSTPSTASTTAGADHRKAQAALTDFIYDRLTGYLRELGYSSQEVDAATALRPARWADLPQRLAAVRAFAALPEAAALAAANKRVGNILKKSEDPAAVGGSLNAALLVEPAEAALAAALQAVAPQADAAFARGDYSASLQSLAALKAPVDAFFDKVMVNSDDPALRNNRLQLLSQLHAAMNRVADLSRLAA